ncbi:TniB family NTP-binding protein [Pseudomonas sp. PA1(2017)]|uniref:TniB family NTP-binding protein n=1 Tax=Pseudomonas sp. PA1(2017) TaxID=1932113 RepID=UPI0011150B74|nr:TniB family NTP-binding protein [Pseudomonas sp. PA1(2017)]
MKELVLGELGVGVGRHARRGHNITPEMQSIIKSKNIRAIVIDEIHDALTLTENQQRINLSLLKNLSGSAYGLSVFAFGIPAAASVLRQDPQLQRRYTVVSLHGWENNSGFRNFVATYIHHLPLKKKTDFNDPKFFQQIMDVGQGITDNVVKVLQACAMASIMDKSEHITRQHLNNIEEIMEGFYFSLRGAESYQNYEGESDD